jgi:hypothetical protein
MPEIMNKEQEYLLGMLKRYAIEINEACTESHASVDKSGAIPQLLVS